MSISSSTVAVVGAGIAGLSAAIRLAVAGKKVIVFEQNSYTGGKVTAFETHLFYMFSANQIPKISSFFGIDCFRD